MRHLWIEIEVLDFDLETIGFHFNVLNPDTTEPKSNSYLRMTLVELGVFIDALKASAANINLAAPKSVAGKIKMGGAPASNEQLVAGQEEMEPGRGTCSPGRGSAAARSARARRCASSRSRGSWR